MAGRDWSRMGRGDFDQAQPLALVEARDVTRRVEAAPHANGTDALFGDAPVGRRVTRSRRPAQAPAEQPDALF
ncbi:hypothetical protein ACFWCA_19140 [Streptomyces phaeochromogenes]|uniref:hypothetical protein n=1 Tax=Streptomyces phaeochromogenes TaxID=1923 RepID=UPI0036A7CF09